MGKKFFDELKNKENITERDIEIIILEIFLKEEA